MAAKRPGHSNELRSNPITRPWSIRMLRQRAIGASGSSVTLGERVMGFEPTTSTLARLRSTPELHPHH